MKEWTKDDIMNAIDQGESAIIYFYTPLCGTCQVAGRMIGVVEHIVNGLEFRKTDLNFMPEIAEHFSIESVPCLLILIEGKVKEKIYAFHSVPFLHEKITQYV